MAAKLGQILITSNIISEEQLKQALNLQKKEGGRLGTNLAKLGYITEEKLVSFLSKQFGVPAINLTDYSIDPSGQTGPPGNGPEILYHAHHQGRRYPYHCHGRSFKRLRHR